MHHTFEFTDVLHFQVFWIFIQIQLIDVVLLVSRLFSSLQKRYLVLSASEYHTVFIHHLLILHHDNSFILAHWFCLFNLVLLNLVQSFILKPQRLRFKDLWRISATTNIENSSIWESGILLNLVNILECSYFHGDWRYLKNF